MPSLAQLRPYLELLFWLSLATFFLGFSFTFDNRADSSYEWGAALWPRAAILLIVVASLFHFYEQRRELEDDPGIVERSDIWTGLKITLPVLLLPLLFVWAIPRMGFYFTAPLFVAAELILLGERRWQRILPLTLGIVLSLFLVFTTLFYVGLPVGNWPGFYEFNTAIIGILR